MWVQGFGSGLGFRVLVQDLSLGLVFGFRFKVGVWPQALGLSIKSWFGYRFGLGVSVWVEGLDLGLGSGFRFGFRCLVLVSISLP